MPVSLNTVSALFGDTAPHGLKELRNKTFMDGTSTPASGIINLNTFEDRFIQTGNSINGVTGGGASTGERLGWSIAMSSNGSRVAVGSRDHSQYIGIVRVYDYSNNQWTQVGSDINGQFTKDDFGYSIAMTSDGSRIVVGAPSEKLGLLGKGCARVYDYSNNQWTQVGSDIDGTNNGDHSGKTVAISSDGTRVAIGSPRYANGGTRGQVQVFNYVNSQWTQLGGDMNGRGTSSQAGEALAMTPDGSRIIIGAPRDPGNLRGYVQVYEYIGAVWTQIGSDIDGVSYNEFLGRSVAISSSGSRIAVGSIKNSGRIRVYDYINSEWIQIGGDILPEVGGTSASVAIAMTPDGSRIIAGDPYDDPTGTYSDTLSAPGRARVYEYDGAAWNQVGAIIEAVAAVGGMTGFSVAISSDGSRFALGAPGHDNYYGQFRVCNQVE